MTQTIIVILILVAVSTWVIYKAVKFFFSKDSTPDKCKNCSGCELSEQLRKRSDQLFDCADFRDKE